MIAGVRQFKLINALGREYDMTRPDALLHAPDGLGWGTEATVNRLGMTYIGINEKEIHQSPSGEMVFRTYEEYGRFLSFCQQGGLVLCYKPIDTWYYCEALISIQKSEIQWENNHLICPVQFTLLSYWYEKVVAQTAEPPEPAEPSYATVTGDPAVFTARYSYPIKDLSVAIQGSQDLNGYDKPWVGGRGKNLFEVTNQSTTLNGVSIEIADDGTIELSGTSTRIITFVLGYITPQADTSYVVSGSPFPTNACRLQFQEGSTTVGNQFNNVELSVSGLNAVQHRLRLYIANNTNVDGVTLKPMIRKAGTSDTFEPYENICPITSFTSVEITQTGSQTNTYTVELTGAGNVYKGTLDVTTGELTVERVVTTVTSVTGVNSTSGAGYIVGTYTLLKQGNIGLKGNYTTEWAGNGDSASMPEWTIAQRGGSNKVFFIKLSSAHTTKADYDAFLSANPAEITLVLQTPLTYTLTPVQLSNLIGSNTIQADAGAVTVTYRTDARTEYKIYPYQYSYKYGDTAQNVFDISCDLPSYFKLTIFGERTNPSWRVVQNGNIVKSGKLNATIGSSQKLVINTDPKNTEIALYTLSNTRINNLYGYSDFATERIFALPQGECQVQVLTEDEQPPKVMIEVLKHV